MNIGDLLGNLHLFDEWYKVITYISCLALIGSLFLEVHGISNFQLQLLSAGLFLFSLGEWKNHKKKSFIKPPNVYTGGPALITYTVREPDLFGSLLNVIGAVLLALGIWNVLAAPSAQSGNAPATLIAPTETQTVTVNPHADPTSATSIPTEKPTESTPVSNGTSPAP